MLPDVEDKDIKHFLENIYKGGENVVEIPENLEFLQFKIGKNSEKSQKIPKSEITTLIKVEPIEIEDVIIKPR